MPFFLFAVSDCDATNFGNCEMTFRCVLRLKKHNTEITLKVKPKENVTFRQRLLQEPLNGSSEKYQSKALVKTKGHAKYDYVALNATRDNYLKKKVSTNGALDLFLSFCNKKTWQMATFPNRKR